ncbi:hypothetical protein D1007_20722 [Hordeum vulgare]|nr:hypothetical protein D1007_20722 [Hordeum vulgare]
MRAQRRLEIKRENIDLEKQEVAIKWELEKANAFGEIEFKERLQLARDAEGAKIMLAGETVLYEHAKKWLVEKNKEIKNRRTLEAVRAVVAAGQVARLQANRAA